jgi:hypothetical protein
LAVKHRQLARQAGVIIDDHQANLMAIFNSTAVLQEVQPSSSALGFASPMVEVV